MHVSTVLSAIHQYVAVNIWSEGRFRQRRSPSSTFFCSALDPPLGISDRNHYQNGSIPSKAFCLWSSLWLLLILPWIHPRADLIKNLNTCAGNENFIPTKVVIFAGGKFRENVGKTFHVGVISRNYSYFLHKCIWVSFSRGSNFRKEDKSQKNANITPTQKLGN